MGDYGLKITQPGYDVANATDEQLVYSTKYSGWKIKAQGSYSFVATGIFQTINLVTNAGSGYGIVFVEDFTSFPNIRYNMPVNASGSIAGNIISKSSGLDVYLVGTTGNTYKIYWYWLSRL